MIDFRKIPAADAQEAAMDFVRVLSDVCERIEIAGSLRRRKPFVKDIEIVFVPLLAAPDQAQRSDFFEAAIEDPVNLAEKKIAKLLELGLAAKRPNVNGVEAWGPKNKLAIHRPSGIAVDLFTATLENFSNYLVCRTGGAESNIRICNAAIARGWKWNPYGAGFSRIVGLANEVHAVQSEREVFEFAGLAYLEPWQR